jgi:hypothetical protein
MSEIISIFSQILFILFIISFPIIILNNNSKSKFYEFSLIDKLCINLIFLINVLFFASILNINSKYILYLYLFLIIFLYFFNFKKINFKNIKINYYFLILLLFIILISIDIAHELYFAWDTKSFWFFKTLNFYQNQKFENLKNFPISDWPHLGAYIWSFFWKFPFSGYEYFGRITYAFIYVLSIFSIVEIVKVHIYQKIILAILFISLTYNYEFFSGLQDILIFSFILIASKFTYYFFEKRYKTKLLELTFILLGIANILCWIKNEGLFFIFFLIFCILIIKNLDLKTKKLLITGSLTIFLIKIFILNYYEIFNSDHFIGSLDFKIFNLFEKMKIISLYLSIYLTQVPIYLITLPILIYTSFKYKMKDITKFNLFFLILNLLFIYVAFLFKSSETELQVRFSLKRVLFETSGFYFLAIVIFINNYLHSFNQKIFSSFKKKH